jgi:hypothetical protein
MPPQEPDWTVVAQLIARVREHDLEVHDSIMISALEGIEAAYGDGTTVDIGERLGPTRLALARRVDRGEDFDSPWFWDRQLPVELHASAICEAILHNALSQRATNAFVGELTELFKHLRGGNVRIYERRHGLPRIFPQACGAGVIKFKRLRLIYYRCHQQVKHVFLIGAGVSPNSTLESENNAFPNVVRLRSSP